MWYPRNFQKSLVDLGDNRESCVVHWDESRKSRIRLDSQPLGGFCFKLLIKFNESWTYSPVYSFVQWWRKPGCGNMPVGWGLPSLNPIYRGSTTCPSRSIASLMVSKILAGLMHCDRHIHSSCFSMNDALSHRLLVTCSLFEDNVKVINSYSWL